MCSSYCPCALNKVYYWIGLNSIYARAAYIQKQIQVSCCRSMFEWVSEFEPKSAFKFGSFWYKTIRIQNDIWYSISNLLVQVSSRRRLIFKHAISRLHSTDTADQSCWAKVTRARLAVWVDFTEFYGMARATISHVSNMFDR